MQNIIREIISFFFATDKSVGSWEHFCYTLGQKVGLKIAKTRSRLHRNLSSFLSGRNVLKAKSAIKSPQTNTTNSFNMNSSHHSSTSGKEIWGVLKKAIVFIVIILYLYNKYYKKDDTTDVVIGTQPTQYQTPQEEVTETESEPQEVWCDCMTCATTGQCQLCFRSGRCGVCGGGGQVYSVFYGDEVGSGRMTECGNCEGSGWCPACEGSGNCFACHGLGKYKLE